MDLRLGVRGVNAWDVLDLIKPLIVEATVIDPDRLADPDVRYPECRCAVTA